MPPAAAKAETLRSQLLQKSTRVVAGIAIIVAAHVFSRVWSAAVTRFLQSRRGRHEPDGSGKETVAYDVVRATLYWIPMSVALVIVLRILGLEIASVLALLGTIGFAVGLAMQGALSDVTAGILLSLGGEFSVGDMIRVSDVEGTVVGFNLLYTTVRSDNTYHFIKIPNRVLYGNILENQTKPATRSFHLHVMVANTNRELGPALRAVERAVQAHAKVLPAPPVRAQVSGVFNYGTELEVRASIRSADYPNANNFSFLHDLVGIAREALVRSDIAFPQFGLGLPK